MLLTDNEMLAADLLISAPVDKSKPEQLISNEDVVESVIEQLLSLVDRINRGEIPPIRDYDL
jgi:hypothetical protein